MGLPFMINKKENETRLMATAKIVEVFTPTYHFMLFKNRLFAQFNTWYNLVASHIVTHCCERLAFKEDIFLVGRKKLPS